MAYNIGADRNCTLKGYDLVENSHKGIGPIRQMTSSIGIKTDWHKAYM